MLNEAISTLKDEKIADLIVTDVIVSKGKYDADIYLDGSDISKDKRDSCIARFKRANRYLQSYCKSNEDWFKIPKFHFKFDDNIEHSLRIEELFKKIKED